MTLALFINVLIIIIIIQGVMSSCPARGSLAHKAVNPTGVYHTATMTLMRNAQIQPEPQANNNSHCLVIHLQSARGNWQTR